MMKPVEVQGPSCGAGLGLGGTMLVRQNTTHGTLLGGALSRLSDAQDYRARINERLTHSI